MARSISYWNDVMLAEKEGMSNLTALQPNMDSSQTLLNDLKSTSKVSRWRLLFWCVATAMYAFDVVLDLFKLFIASLVSSSKYGTLPWYTILAKSFQYGDNLVYEGNQYQYAVIDPTKQIIKRASADESSGSVVIKVAKDVSGTNTKLDPAELVAFTYFMKQSKPPGIVLNIISSDPDDLQLFVDVIYDPAVLSATGESLAAPGTFPVIDASNTYIKSLNDDFNGWYDLMKAIDAIESVLGVITADVTDAKARKGAEPFVSFARRYKPFAGHIKIDVGTPLTGTINYIANV